VNQKLLKSDVWTGSCIQDSKKLSNSSVDLQNLLFRFIRDQYLSVYGKIAY